jgi:hypothetical protein
MRSYYLAFVSLSFALLACGEIKPNNGPVDVSVDASVDARPVSLTMMKSGNGSGTVTSSPAGVDCGSDCIAAYAPGTTVTLTATPDGGTNFIGWTGGGCTGTGTCVVTVTADTSIEAAFAKQQFTVTVTPNGDGAGTVTSTPIGIDCGSTCDANFDIGTQVTLMPAPAAGMTFVGWTGGGCTGTGPCIVTVTANTTMQASFAHDDSLVVTRAGNGTGTVTSSDGTISCGTNCSYQYPRNSIVTLIATAGAHSNFAGWSGGGCTGTGACVVTMSAATNVTATFTLQTFTLTTARAGNGGGVVRSVDNNINCDANCSFIYSYGTMVTLNATANIGSTFSGWSGGGCSGTGACVVTITAVVAVTATFTLNPYTLQVNKSGGGEGTVTSNVGGINCGVTCSAQINYNTVVTLLAAATNGATFVGWSGGGCSGTGFCVVTVSAATTVTATFMFQSVPLTSGVPVPSLSGATGTQRNFSIAVGAGQTVIVQISGGTGDADLYTRAGAAPTLSTFNCASNSIGNNETCTATVSAATTMFIMLDGYSAYNGVTLVATVATVLGNNVPVLNLLGASGSQQFFKLTVPAGQTSVVFQITGSVPDADLYVRRGSAPTTALYDCRPFTGTSNETCNFSNPAAGDWYVMVRSFSAYSGVTLVGHFP